MTTRPVERRHRERDDEGYVRIWDWGPRERFLHARAELIREMLDDGEDWESVRAALSMDLLQVKLIAATELDQIPGLPGAIWPPKQFQTPVPAESPQPKAQGDGWVSGTGNGLPNGATGWVAWRTKDGYGVEWSYRTDGGWGSDEDFDCPEWHDDGDPDWAMHDSSHLFRHRAIVAYMLRDLPKYPLPAPPEVP